MRSEPISTLIGLCLDLLATAQGFRLRVFFLTARVERYRVGIIYQSGRIARDLLYPQSFNLVAGHFFFAFRAMELWIYTFKKMI